MTCSEEYKKKELKRIINIAIKNRYKSSIVFRLDKAIQKTREENGNQRERPKQRYVGSMNYVEGMSENIINILKKEEINVGLKVTAKIDEHRKER